MAQVSPIPTVNEILAATAVGCGFHDFAVEGGTLRLTTAELRPALEAAYDSTCPDWVEFVDLEDYNTEDTFLPDD
jgi:hypothetical protein